MWRHWLTNTDCLCSYSSSTLSPANSFFSLSSGKDPEIARTGFFFLDKYPIFYRYISFDGTYWSQGVLPSMLRYREFFRSNRSMTVSLLVICPGRNISRTSRVPTRVTEYRPHSGHPASCHLVSDVRQNYRKSRDPSLTQIYLNKSTQE